jgi:Flp pilus assembly protein TadG
MTPFSDAGGGPLSKRSQSRRRPAAQAVEAAIVFPVLLLLLIALIVGGMGVFHYQQAACLAQEAARWASVRGGDYQKDTDQASPTRDQIFQQAVLPLAVSLDPSQLSLQVQWVNQATGAVQDWDGSPKDVKSLTAQGEYVTNSVRATVTWTWSPGVLIGPVTITSVCEAPMAN